MENKYRTVSDFNADFESDLKKMYEIAHMSDKEAADILKQSLPFISKNGRANGKSIQHLMYLRVIEKAIEALEERNL